MDEVMTLSVWQTEFQQQRLIHGQRLLFEHFDILYLYPPSSPSSSLLAYVDINIDFNDNKLHVFIKQKIYELCFYNKKMMLWN